ncbi:MAG: SagB/ThcOx family dehydrogenase [Syntrophobacteraceae bacterium]|nr:SagB/ThcOx family dehydrogenase [Syntrophobacteraceae bacterium]
MKSRFQLVTGFLFALAITFLFSLGSFAGEPASIKLPDPQKNAGKPVMAALNSRMSSRTFSGEKLSLQTLSNLLWAAFGINRSDGKRTAPSAFNRQETDIFVVTADGVYIYDAKNNALDPVLKGDVRAMTGTQGYVKSAPVILVYVADYSKVQGGSADSQLTVGADVGVIAENVYLFCASQGLATVVRGAIDKDELAKTLKLRPEQKIILDQPVGHRLG